MNESQELKELIKIIGMRIRQYIHERRVELNYTQEELASKSKVDSNSISNLETGKVNPLAVTVIRLLLAFDDSSIDLKEILKEDYEKILKVLGLK